MTLKCSEPSIPTGAFFLSVYQNLFLLCRLLISCCDYIFEFVKRGYQFHTSLFSWISPLLATEIIVELEGESDQRLLRAFSRGNPRLLVTMDLLRRETNTTADSKFIVLYNLSDWLFDKVYLNCTQCPQHNQISVS